MLLCMKYITVTNDIAGGSLLDVYYFGVPVVQLIVPDVFQNDAVVGLYIFYY